MPSTRAGAASPKAVARPASTRSAAASTPTRITSRKRAVDGDKAEESTPNKKKKTSAKERSVNDPYNPENNLVDSLRPGLVLVMCGLNPGLQTALTGTIPCALEPSSIS